MRETITEVEAVEREREVIYCDECGDEVDERDVRYEPKEVCVGCSGETWYERVADLPEAEPLEDPAVAWLILGIIFWPLLVGAGIWDVVDTSTDDPLSLAYLTGGLGVAVWGGVILLALL